MPCTLFMVRPRTKHCPAQGWHGSTAAVLEHQISSQRGNGKRFTNLRAGKLKALLHSVLRNVCDLPQTRLLCV